MKIATTLSKEDLITLKKNKVVKESNLKYHEKKFDTALKKLISKYTGSDDGLLVFLGALSNGNDSMDITKFHRDLLNILKIDKEETYLFEAKVKDYLCVSMRLNDYLKFSKRFRETNNELRLEILEEELSEFVVIGNFKNTIKNENMITFIPFLSVKDCSSVLIIEENWRLGEESKLVEFNNIGEFLKLKIQ